MKREATVEIEVPFHDLDPMNVAWHGNYLKYFELARCALLDTIDYNYPQMEASGYVWPIVDLRVKYVKSAVFAQKLLVTASLSEFHNRLRLDYLVRCKASGAKLTKGYSIQVAVDKQNGEMQFVSPKVLFDKLGEAWPH
ncbi:acyl-CoA thioesterase [Gallaecimonas xiamenensis]|uniref:4-hydroxybenzoyl-CoA thioesterase n=1 Tax=Gallaecimonas xiamenensis 3-C-1 TaxID=745411 RepID=K2J189_9GAMM|nr:thioesterase family protein [Gallaecimonas xiamenensis]EKE76661.1 4-hydroxybenzoyl-CoA thioesterase [Gallaecimonas xiamenensis 3-C-1]